MRSSIEPLSPFYEPLQVSAIELGEDDLIIQGVLVLYINVNRISADRSKAS